MLIGKYIRKQIVMISFSLLILNFLTGCGTNYTTNASSDLSKEDKVSLPDNNTITSQPNLTTITPQPTLTLPQSPADSSRPLLVVDDNPLPKNEDGFYINDSSLQNIKIANADINRDGYDESLSVDASVYDACQPAYLKIYDKDQKLIYKEQLFSPHCAQNSFYLCNVNGKPYLLSYNPYCIQESASYQYDLFYLNKKNEKVIEESSKLDFNLNYFDGCTFNIPSMLEYYKKINSYLSHGILLVSTLNDLEYSTETNKIVKKEEYSFLYEFPRLSNSKNDTLEEKLSQYYQHMKETYEYNEKYNSKLKTSQYDFKPY